MTTLRWILAGAFAVALAGCESAPIKGIQELFQGGKGEQELAEGIRLYEDGHYNESARFLQSSLDEGLSGKDDQVKAHKFLAFIHCVSGRETQCRREFRAVLKADPSFDLAENEAGHPIWGPVFRSVKARSK